MDSRSPNNSLYHEGNTVPSPSLAFLRYLLILFTCIVIGSTLLCIVDTIRFRHRKQRGRTSKSFVDSYRWRTGAGRLEPLDMKVERIGEEGDGERCAAVEPDVRDTCVST